MKNIVLAPILMLAATAQANAQSEPVSNSPPAVKSIDVKKGDQWVYETRDELTGRLKFTTSAVVSDVTDSEIDVRVTNKATSTNAAETTYLEVFDRRWRKTEGPKYTFKKSQEFWGVPDDIAVGREWTYSYEERSVSSPQNFKWAGHGEVVAWEKVSLPSGQSFDAFKIEYHEATTRNANNQIEIVTEATPGNLRAEMTVVEWYAPLVNRYVKRTYDVRQNGKLLNSGSEMLTLYSRRGPD